jgi:hypothetical protein
MPQIITLEQYAGPYLAHVDLTLERRSAAIDLLGAVNAVLAMAEADGVEFERNPNTRTLISGNGNGGFRPQACPIGAANSAHKQGQGIDIAEVLGRRFARWCLANQTRLQQAGIRAMEDPRWTPLWVHLQTRSTSSGRFVFIPDNTPPHCPALPEQKQ